MDGAQATVLDAILRFLGRQLKLHRRVVVWSASWALECRMDHTAVALTCMNVTHEVVGVGLVRRIPLCLLQIAASHRLPLRVPDTEYWGRLMASMCEEGACHVGPSGTYRLLDAQETVRPFEVEAETDAKALVHRPGFGGGGVIVSTLHSIADRPDRSRDLCWVMAS